MNRSLIALSALSLMWMAGCAAPPTAGTAPTLTSAYATSSPAARTSASYLPGVTKTESGMCGPDKPLVDKVREFVSQGSTWFQGTVQPTGKVVSGAGIDADADFTEVEVTIAKVLAGPGKPGQVLAYVLGGSQKGHTTVIDSSLKSAWSGSGQAFGQLRKSESIDKGPSLDVLPIVNGSVSFVGVGCWSTTGLKASGPKISRIVTIDDSSGQSQLNLVPLTAASVTLANIEAAIAGMK